MKTNRHLRHASLSMSAALFLLFFTSCSKEELAMPNEDTTAKVISATTEKEPVRSDRKRYQGKTNSDIRALDAGYDPCNPSGKKNLQGDDRLELVDHDRCRNGGCSLLIDEKVTKVIPVSGDLGLNLGRSIGSEPVKDNRYFQPKQQD